MPEAEQNTSGQTDMTGQSREDKTGQTRQDNLDDKTRQDRQDRTDKTGQMGNTTVAAELKPFDLLLKESWVTYRKKLSSLIGIIVLSIGLTILGVVAACVLVFIGAALFQGNAVLAIVISAILLIAMITAIFFVNFWSMAATIWNIGSETKTGVIDSYKQTKRQVGRYFWTSLLAGWVTLAGFSFFFVPGVIFCVWFAFATMVVIFEPEKGMAALLKSREYVRGKWWGTALYLTGISLIFGFLQFAAGTLNVALIGIFKLILNIDFSFVGELLNFVESIIFFVLSPLQIVFVVKIYQNLKEIKQGVDLSPRKSTRTFVILAIVLGTIILLATIALIIVGIAALSQSGFDWQTILQTMETMEK